MSIPVWNLEAIQTTARQNSGQLSVNQLSDDQLNFYINAYYTYDFPREVKLDEQYTQYTFQITQGQNIYSLPSVYTHIENPIYINGEELWFTENTGEYYRNIPILVTQQQLGITDGTNATYTSASGAISALTLLPIQNGVANSVLVTDGIENFNDDGQGVLTGSLGGSGTINYVTGAISITFASVPPQGQIILSTYTYMVLGFPNTVLFLARQFTFYPCPDTQYQIRVRAYMQSIVYVDGNPSNLSSVFVNPDDTPQKNEWGEMIALGAAKKILRDFGQADKYVEAEAFYQVERSKVMSDTDNQYMNIRSLPKF